MSGKFYSRNSRYYDGTDLTTRRMGELLPRVLTKIGRCYQQQGEVVLSVWPEIIGSRLAPMTQALSFVEGVLVVKVKNSTLLSILNQHERTRLLSLLRKKFPNIEIKNICFRIG